MLIRTFTVLLAALFTTIATAADQTITVADGSTREQKIAAVALLKKAVPEFSSFCDSFPSAELRVDQFDKKAPNLTIVLQCMIAGKYYSILIYDVAFKSNFTEVDRVIDEHLGVHRRDELDNMKRGQVLAPILITRADLEQVARDGDIYLNQIYDKRPRAGPKKKG